MSVCPICLASVVAPRSTWICINVRRYWLLRATKSQNDFSRQGFHAVGNRSNQCEHGSWHEVMPSVQKHWYWREATSIVYFVRPSALQVIFPYVYLQCDSLFAERLSLHRACNECVHLITALTSISCLSINLSIDYISYLVKKLITTATKKLHMPFRHFSPLILVWFLQFYVVFCLFASFLTPQRWHPVARMPTFFQVCHIYK